MFNNHIKIRPKHTLLQDVETKFVLQFKKGVCKAMHFQMQRIHLTEKNKQTEKNVPW